MMEAGANEMPEDLVLEAIQRAQQANQGVIDLQDEIVGSIGKPKAAFDAGGPKELDAQAATVLGGRLTGALDSSQDKAEQDERLNALRAELVETLSQEFQAGEVSKAFESLLEKEFKERLLAGANRPDGRGRRRSDPSPARWRCCLAPTGPGCSAVARLRP